MIESIIKFLAAKFHWDMSSTDVDLLKVPTPSKPPLSDVLSLPTQTTPSEAPTAPSKPDMIQVWSTAVAHWEGANPLSNNPGNLKISTLTESWGATKGHQAEDGGYFCQFQTYAQGFQALYNFLKLGAEGELIISNPKPCSLREFTIRFAGNPPEGYIRGICQMMGVVDSVNIATFLG